MRLPRHDTLLSLPAEPPRLAIAADEALLDGPPGQLRLWVAAKPAVVVGLGLHHRLSSVVDIERCDALGVEVVDRRAGGGALLLDESVVCGAICIPATDDVTESYRWLGDVLAFVLNGRRVEVAEARADVASLRSRDDAVARLLLDTCYGALSPHEVVIGHQKVVGLAQIRRRGRALFQFGILQRDQSMLADYLMAGDVREQLRDELAQRTIGLPGRSASEVAVAIADAMPSVP